MSTKYFVISLKKSVERRASISSILSSQGVDFEIFDATYGKEMTPEEQALFHSGSDPVLNMKAGRSVSIGGALSPAEKGCALSHLRLYQHILDQGLEHAVIMEDDVQPHPDAFEAVARVDCIKEPWDVINFSSDYGIRSLPGARKYFFREDKNFYFQRLGMRNDVLDAIFNTRRIVLFNMMYIVTASACRKLLEIGYPVRLPADYLNGIIAWNHLKTFAVFPHNHFYAEPVFESTIGDRADHKITRL